jgi:hypothetical protein
MKFGIIAWLLIILSTIPAWFTHVIVCIQDEKWLFLIAGAIMAPIAVIHGWGVWFGLF